VKIVIVDDDADILRMMTRLLAHRGHEVHGCDSPFGVSAMVVRYAPDLVLLDVMMPGLNGLALAEVIRALPIERQPRIVLWSAMEPDQLRRAGRDSALPTISKTVAPSQIVVELERVARAK
jgi:two-component system phosphate regulon response regulator OmpR